MTWSAIVRPIEQKKIIINSNTEVFRRYFLCRFLKSAKPMVDCVGTTRKNVFFLN